MSNKALADRPEWAALARHRAEMEGVRILDLFRQDPERFSRCSLSLPGVMFDYSKHRITGETMGKLCALARACGVEERREAMYSGKIINASESRAVLHMALRGSQPAGLKTAGAHQEEDVAAFVSDTLAQMRRISETIRADAAITDIVHIGIGGSDLGPAMVCHALAPLADGPRIHFLPNVDGQCADGIMRTLKPENTALIVASKTFSTLETMTNAHTLRRWMENALPAPSVRARMIGVTMNAGAAEEFGIDPANILPLREWIGGRFSVWGAVGLPVAIANGFDGFEELLKGARAADEHFLNAPLEDNIPVLMALLGVWYRNFWGYGAQAILPYAQSLARFKAYIQQLDMESNGKSVDNHGAPITYATGPVIFGEVGSNAQHAFMQMMHQSAEVIPADFILVARPEHGLRDHHDRLLANALAQSRALMEGAQDTRAPHLSCPGDRPSSTLVLDRLDAYHLGALVALYEHKIFVQGAVWGINSFDQWGVELGKILAAGLIGHFENHRDIKDLDPSTAGLLAHLSAKFTKS
jgi:glucose-6-phosphate isomerase